MKSRKPFLKSLLGKFRKTTATAETQPRTILRQPAARKVVSSIEGLEGRIAPATLLNPSTLLFTDLDGDLVTVKFSKNIFVNTLGSTDLQKANAVFKFSGANAVVAGTTATPQLEQLQLIDLSSAAVIPLANGTSISVTATAAAGGNGSADVGAIRAAFTVGAEQTGLALGAVTIDGDLGQIDAGRSGVKTAVASLTVGSLGVKGTATQDSGSTPNLVSTLRGALGSLKVFGDVQDARVNVINGTAANGLTPLGTIGNIVIEGSLLGRTAVEAGSNNSGRIDATGNVGHVRIGTDATEGIFGGGGEGSGQITVGGKIASLTVSGKIVGGAAASSGTVFASSTIGAVKIGSDLTGGITGGSAASAGSVQAGGTITSVTISGDLTGAAGNFSGIVLSSSGSIGPVKIGGKVAGGGGENSGRIQASTTLVSVAIAEDLVAGTGANSGTLSAPSIGVVTVEDIDGRTASAAPRSGGISGGKLNSLTVTGSIFGGTAGQTGFVEIQGDIGTVKVLGNIEGGTGVSSGAILAYGKIATVTVNGNLEGGDGIESGQIVSGFDPVRIGDLGVVKILGRIEGGVGDKSGSIRSGGKITSLLVGTAGAAPLDILLGGAGDRSGLVESQGLLGSVKIIGNLVGGAGDFSGTIRSVDRFETTGEIAGDLGAVSITGQLRGGAGTGSGGLLADGNLRSLTVGSWLGGTGAESGNVETGTGIVHPGTSGAIKVLGIFQANGTPGAGSASVLIGGNLASLSILGATDGATVRVGDALGVLSIRGDVSDTLVSARGQVKQGKTTDVAIASIAITGSVTDSEILAGYRVDGLAENGDAQIGTVVVTGAWTRSSLVAGVVDADADGFGDSDDSAIGIGSTTIVSRIASIVIGGAVSGTAAILGDHFGFVAQQIGKMKVGTFTFPLSATTGQVFEQNTAGVNGALGATGNDVSIREVV